MFSQALQAPACHENMVKVGSYVLGEFGNLIAGDQRSSPAVQFQLLHSKVKVKNLSMFHREITCLFCFFLISVPSLFSQYSRSSFDYLC